MNKTVQKGRFNHLTMYQPRAFVPENVNLSDVDLVTGLYQRLLDESIESEESLQAWVLKRSELDSVIDQHRSILYIEMSCQTDDQGKAKAYESFTTDLSPVIQKFDFALNQRYLELKILYPLSEDRFFIYDRSIATEVELFKEDNIDRHTQLSLLSQEYQKTIGAMMVDFDGEEKTLPQMSKYLQETDRQLRQSAWEKISTRRYKDKEAIDGIFQRMITLRQSIAETAGFKNYRDYKFKALHRFDYTPADCFAYHENVQKHVVPIWKKIVQRRCREMSLERLSPWDLSVDPQGRSPLKPFTDCQDLIQNCEKIFFRIDPTLGQQFKDMNDSGLLDLESRKGKAPGGYQTVLSEVRKPFIFMNAVGIDDDIWTLLHEAGHAFHSQACRDEVIHDYRHSPMEFCEVASMAMELLGSSHLDVFYNDEEQTRSITEHLEGIVYVLVWVAIVDAFQHWLYENPEVGIEDRHEQWLKINQSFGTGLIDWSRYTDYQRTGWHRQLHIFEVPFYYVEYGIAQLGALQVWQNAKKDVHSAVKHYRQALALGGTKTLPELFASAAIRFDFSAQTIQPLMKDVAQTLQLD